MAQNRSKILTIKEKHRAIKSRLTKFSKYLEEIHQEIDKEALEIRLIGLQDHYKVLKELHDNNDVSTENEIDQEILTNSWIEIEEDYYTVVAKTRKLLKPHNNNQSNPSNTSRSEIVDVSNEQSVTSYHIKLPDITLPKFDGSIEHWPAFRDKFLARVDQNKNLSYVDKFQYLQSSLSGKAARAIDAIETTEENYKEAWDILKGKYDNTRKTILRHWTLLHNIPKLSRDTPEQLEELVDIVRQHLRALTNLGDPIESANSCIIHLILSKINEVTIYQWETTLKDNKVPSYTSLLEFLEKRANCTNLFPSKNTPFKANVSHSSKPPRGQSFFTNTQDNTFKLNCSICKLDHKIYQCPKFLALNNEKRRKEVGNASLCYNCLARGHSVKNCQSGSSCEDRPTQALSYAIDIPIDDILPTALINVFNTTNETIPCRALLDSGSSANFIAKQIADKIKSPKRSCSIPVGALNGLSMVATEIITVTISSRSNKFTKTLDFLVVPQICALTPQQHFDRGTLKIPKNILLADPQFHKPAPIDLLLGTGVSLSLLSVGQIKLVSDQSRELVLQKTLLGWIIGGSMESSSSYPTCNQLQLINDLTKFWELEEVSNTRHLSPAEKQAELHFQQNTQRNNDGRYIVALPFNEKREHLGHSKQMAMKRFLALEKHLKRDTNKYQLYKDIIEEYKTLGHMKKQSNETDNGFYLPHHAVIKESSMTTKLRVVFDGSAATSTGVSLNQALLIGPTIQDDLFSHLLRFRLHRYVVTGDIEKMYRQILVREEDQKYQRILWRDEDNTISTYELSTVTFGLGPAPFLAVRCIQQLVEDEGYKYPLAIRPLQRELYMDDLLSGADTIEEARTLRDQVIDLLQSGGFNLRQFASNSPEVLQGLPDTRINLKLQQHDDYTLKTLGVYWDSSQDAIKYEVQPLKQHIAITKRVIASEVARIFDPLGLVNPSIVQAKLIMQELWKLQLDWDESVPQEIYSKWKEFSSQLHILNDLAFDRFSLHENAKVIELHGFCDASEVAYGACIYIKSINEFNESKVSLYCAKSRVAPMKNRQTIPRLELCAAVLLSNLYKSIKSAIDIEFDKLTFWSDSTIVLHWINTPPHTLKTFVANRVVQILTISNPTQWRHVRTHDNPADIISRGESPINLCQNQLWRYGPTWLTSDESHWPKITLPGITELPDCKKVQCLSLNKQDYSILTRFSSFTRLQRVIAYCLRFKKLSPRCRHLTINELKIAHDIIIKLTQSVTFANEINSLKQGKPIDNKSQLLSLSPFLDDQGLLRVGGRLRNSSYSYDIKHPILLPKSHHITKLLLTRAHIETLHAGIQNTLCHIRQQYWPINGKNQIRQIINRCIRCCRIKPPTVNYIMGDLPKFRLHQTRPFLNTGVDYCGPFFIKEKKFRNKVQVKIYVAVFICLTTRAIHLEVVSDLTTEGFLSALKRFISRRGRCVNLYSDNGLNFVGANNRLKEILTTLQSEEHNVQVRDWLTTQHIEWHFNPPYSPHFGGIWEAAVKSFKHHLIRILGNELFTFEQFNTLTIEIEAILNSRPLTPLSSDPNDFHVLTPAHFLIGDSLTSLPDFNYTMLPTNRLSAWQQIQRIKQLFWRRWHTEYINELNVKHKWSQGNHNIDKGSMVLIRDDNHPSLQWRMGRIIETLPGKDGIIRVARIQTTKGIIERSIKTLAPLPRETDNQNS